MCNSTGGLCLPTALSAIGANVAPGFTIPHPLPLGKDKCSLEPVSCDIALARRTHAHAQRYLPCETVRSQSEYKERKLHLRFAGIKRGWISSNREMIKGDLVRLNGTSALACQYLVVPDLAPVRKMVVSHGRQFNPFAGAAALVSGDLIEGLPPFRPCVFL